MNGVNDQIQTHHINNSQNNQMVQAQSQSIGKEKEVGGVAATETITPVASEIVLPKEVEKTGVVSIPEIIEIPPSVANMGVGASGSSTPFADTTALPSVVLPISDQQVMAGLHAQVTSALLWMAVWCMKKLKKAHVTLKNIHGKIVRVKT